MTVAAGGAVAAVAATDIVLFLPEGYLLISSESAFNFVFAIHSWSRTTVMQGKRVSYATVSIKNIHVRDPLCKGPLALIHSSAVGAYTIKKLLFCFFTFLLFIDFVIF
jgi:hypothetical protein